MLSTVKRAKIIAQLNIMKLVWRIKKTKNLNIVVLCILYLALTLNNICVTLQRVRKVLSNFNSILTKKNGPDFLNIQYNFAYQWRIEVGSAFPTLELTAMRAIRPPLDNLKNKSKIIYKTNF